MRQRKSKPNQPLTGKQRVARSGATVGLLISILLGSSFLYQTLAEARDRRAYPPPGQFVDVGGYRLHLQVMGADQPGPTVLLEHGAGSTASQWGWIQSEVAQFARVVTYDRPGLGYSEAPPAPLTPAQFNADLLTALMKLGIHGPYIVGGHSMGGLFALAFAQAHPNDVAGVVLIDALTTDNATFVREVFNITTTTNSGAPLFERIGPQFARFGLMRFSQQKEMYVQQLPAQQAGEFRAALASYHQWAGISADLKLADQHAAFPQHQQLQNIPLRILSSGAADNDINAEERQRFIALQARALPLSAHAEQQVINEADHYSIVTQRESALSVVSAIRQLVTATRGAGA